MAYDFSKLVLNKAGKIVLNKGGCIVQFKNDIVKYEVYSNPEKYGGCLIYKIVNDNYIKASMISNPADNSYIVQSFSYTCANGDTADEIKINIPDIILNKKNKVVNFNNQFNMNLVENANVIDNS